MATLPTICPRCFKAIGQTDWCRLCRDHNDPDTECLCPECQEYDVPIPQEHNPNPFVRGIALFALLITVLLAAAPARAHDYPIIGTEVYTHSCTIMQQWEDGSAVAFCYEDGETYVYDPDGDITTGKAPGWYVLDGR